MYHVEVSNNSKTSFKALARNVEILIDLEGRSFTPLEALLAGIGSCVGVYLNRFFEMNKISVNYNISLEAELTKSPPICFRDINIVINLNGMKMDDHKMKQMMEVVKKCPAHNTLKNNPNIKFAVI